MIFLRVVPVVLLLWPCVSLAQENLLSASSLKSQSVTNPDLKVFTVDQNGKLQHVPTQRDFMLTPDGQLAVDSTCYTMRSYVVARDNRQSDSTHFVRYSTCQPASKYRLKTAEIEGGNSLRVAP